MTDSSKTKPDTPTDLMHRFDVAVADMNKRDRAVLYRVMLNSLATIIDGVTWDAALNSVRNAKVQIQIENDARKSGRKP